MSKSFQIFIWLCGLLFLANIFLLNGYFSILIPFESESLLSWFQVTEANNLPGILANYLMDRFGLDTNYLRLGGPAFLLFSTFAFISLSRPLFGRDTLLAFFLVMISSPFFVLLIKMINADIWLAGIQLLALTFILRASKQKDIVWKISYWISMLIGSLIHPLMMLIWAGVFISCLAIFASKRNKYLEPAFGLGLLIPAVFLFLDVQVNGFLFSYGQLPFHYYLFGIFLSVITWIGFLIGGFRDIIWKLGKKEELSNIFLAWFISGIATGGLITVFGFGLLIAKQLQLYFLKNYPRGAWVKTAAILFLLASFFGALWLIFFTHNAFGGEGLRPAVLVAGLFWASAFWSILGLFSRDRSWVVGGFTFLGLVPTFLALLFLIPKFDVENQWVKTVFVEEKKQWIGETLYLPKAFWKNPKVVENYAALNKASVTEDSLSATVFLEKVDQDTPNQLRAESFSIYTAGDKINQDFVFRPRK